jgi:uncharacterized protein (DUF427 family)
MQMQMLEASSHLSHEKRYKGNAGYHDWKPISAAVTESDVKKLTNGYSWYYSETRTKTLNKIIVKR